MSWKYLLNKCALVAASWGVIVFSFITLHYTVRSYCDAGKLMLFGNAVFIVVATLVCLAGHIAAFCWLPDPRRRADELMHSLQVNYQFFRTYCEHAALTTSEEAANVRVTAV